jgi:hypothetical protein
MDFGKEIHEPMIFAGRDVVGNEWYEFDRRATQNPSGPL